MDGIFVETEFQYNSSPFLRPYQGTSSFSDKVPHYSTPLLAPASTSNGHTWIADDTLLSEVDIAKDDTNYFKKLYGARLRFLFIEKTEVEYIYSTCLMCGRKYVVDMTLVGDKSSLGKIEFVTHRCHLCT
jgi:hypothetical protein